VIIDAVSRLVPGVVGDSESVAADSFSRGLLDYPQFTRPAEFRGWTVPEVLVSGHHGEVERWRRAAAYEKTRRNRPDLGEEEATMTARAAVRDWVDRYVRAWDSNDAEEIGNLFTDDAEYFTAPHRQPWRGRDEIVRQWLGRKDDPGTWNFRSEVLGVDGDTGFVRGWTEYTGAGDPDPGPFTNMWQIRLDADGRCSLFVEWWMDESA
jgi:ketosteroid isomerase-like protein